MTFGPDFELVEAGGLWCLRSRVLRALDGVVHAFTTRRSTLPHPDPLTDPVLRGRVLVALGFEPDGCVELLQRHTARVVEVRAEDGGGFLGVADAAVTTSPGVVLTVRTSDCLPVLLADPQAGVVAAAHAGWRGLSSGILMRTVETMVARGARTDRIAVAVGPSIGPCCYEVDVPVVEALGPWRDGALRPARPGHWMLDLRAVARSQLRACGVFQVSFCPACTACDAEWFFSYRRDGRVGRMEGLIALRS